MKKIKNELSNASGILYKLQKHSKNPKFKNLSLNELKRAKLFKQEAKNTKYRKYKRGSIVLVDFGLNHGSEFSFPHFAIVLDKKDNPSSQKLTVVPLTSKKGKDNINLEKEIYNRIFYYIERLANDYREIHDIIQNLFNFSETIPSNDTIIRTDNPKYLSFVKRHDTEDVPTLLTLKDLIFWQSEDAVKIGELKKHYEKYKKNSYAKVDNITTVSKLKICLPINDFDPISNAVVSDNVLLEIEHAFAKRYLSNNIHID